MFPFVRFGILYENFVERNQWKNALARVDVKITKPTLLYSAAHQLSSWPVCRTHNCLYLICPGGFPPQLTVEWGPPLQNPSYTGDLDEGTEEEVMLIAVQNGDTEVVTDSSLIDRAGATVRFSAPSTTPGTGAFEKELAHPQQLFDLLMAAIKADRESERGGGKGGRRV